MSTSRLPKNMPDAEQPPPEAIPGPVTKQQVERRFLGLPARFALLCLGCAALGATVGLFASGTWVWGVAALLFALLSFAALTAAARQKGELWPARSVRLAADRRAQAAAAAEVWRTRLETSLTRWRIRSRLEELELGRAPLLQALGEAVHHGDEAAENEARQGLKELDERRTQIEAELDEQIAGAEERIRLARLPVQETLLVAPDEPRPENPPPGEGDPLRG